MPYPKTPISFKKKFQVSQNLILSHHISKSMTGNHKIPKLKHRKCGDGTFLKPVIQSHRWTKEHSPNPQPLLLYNASSSLSPSCQSIPVVQTFVKWILSIQSKTLVLEIFRRHLCNRRLLCIVLNNLPVEMVVSKWLQMHEPNFYREKKFISLLVTRWNKCHYAFGNSAYSVEKQLMILHLNI
jgi:hypothetical protein